MLSVKALRCAKILDVAFGFVYNAQIGRRRHIPCMSYEVLTHHRYLCSECFQFIHGGLLIHCVFVTTSVSKRFLVIRPNATTITRS